MQKNKASVKKKAVTKSKARDKPSRRPSKSQRNSYSSVITTGDISEIGGTLQLAGRDIRTHETASGIRADEIRDLFDGLYQTIESRAATSHHQKEAVEAEVKEIQSAVMTDPPKNNKAMENLLFHRLTNIARMAPDVLDVVVKTLANPVLGLGEVARKIAKKAEEQLQS